MTSALNNISNDNSLQDHWIKRLIAIIIDCLIIYIIGTVLMLFVWLPLEALDLSDTYQWTLFFPAISGVILFLYSFIMEGASGNATIGKRVMNLRVIAISGKMNMGKAAIRNLSKIHGLFLFLDWLVGFVTDGDPKQKWFDRVGGSTVVLTTALTENEQHIYQSQQAKYAPPPQEPYATRHENAYQYPPASPKAAPQQTQASENNVSTQIPVHEAHCGSCGGRMSETGAGRMKCIRCGKIQ